MKKIDHIERPNPNEWCTSKPEKDEETEKDEGEE